MTRSPVPHLAPAAVALVVAAMLAGCSDGHGAESTSTASPPSPTMTTTTAEGEPFQTVTVPLVHFIWLNQTPSDPTVRFYQTSAQRDKLFSSGCPGGPGTLSGQSEDAEFIWLGVWNRTGQVIYQQYRAWPVSTHGTFDRSIQLPPDPPYLLWSGSTCIGEVTIQFHGTDWRKLPTGRGGDPDPVGSIDETMTRYVTLDFPLGATEADGLFTVGGATYMIELQPHSGSWDRGSSPLGDAYVYAPDQANGGDWFIHSYWHATEDGWENAHRETGMPGRYRYHAKLDAPALQATTWTGRLWVYEFVEPELARLGFQVPFNA